MRSPEAVLPGSVETAGVGLGRRVTAGGAILAATLPIVLLHLRYQPSVALHAGGASVTFKLSDAMVLLTVLVALAAAVRRGVRDLRVGLPVWITGVLFLVWIVLATFYPLLSPRSYAWKTHLVTAGEFCEYALLAPATVLLLRRRADALLALGALVAWTAVAAAVGAVQFAGWSGLQGWGRGHRQPSFLSPHELGALGALSLLLGLLALLWDVRDRRLRAGAWTAVVAGLVAFVLGGASAGVLGLVPAAVLAAATVLRRRLVEPRRLAALVLAVAVSCVAVLALRAGDFGQFLRFAGVSPPDRAATTNIQTYSQRTLLAYIGLRIWLHHPIVGVGWQGSNEVSAFGPELPAAHARFPHVAPIAFPSAAHPYGVQILYLQALADLGVVGFALLLALIVAALAVGVRAALRAPPAAAFAAALGTTWLVVLLGFWSAEGLVAGIPLEAMTWLAVGAICSRGYTRPA